MNIVHRIAEAKSSKTSAIRYTLRILEVIPGDKEISEKFSANAEIEQIKKTGFTVEEFYLTSRTSIPSLVRSFLDYRRILNSFNPHIVHAHFGSMTSFFCAVSSLKPLVITFRGSDINPSPHDGFIRDLIQKTLSNLSVLRAKKIICVSRELKNRLWWHKNKAIVIPPSVDVRVFYPRPQSEARELLGFGSNDKIIVFNAGSNPRVKRLDLAEKAVALVKQRVPSSRFVVLKGDVPHDKIPLYLNAADCLIVTSDYEGSPNIVKEAVACNLPVVSFDVGDVRERLKGVNPSKIVERDPSSVADVVIEILEAGTRSNGSDSIQNLSVESNAKRIISVYAEI